MLRPRFTRQFKRDVKRLKGQGLGLGLLGETMDLLIGEEALDARRRLHRLHGEFRGHWECHLAPDWLLIWYFDGEEIVFVRTGSHSELFD